MCPFRPLAVPEARARSARLIHRGVSPTSTTPFILGLIFHSAGRGVGHHASRHRRDERGHAARRGTTGRRDDGDTSRLVIGDSHEVIKYGFSVTTDAEKRDHRGRRHVRHTRIDARSPPTPTPPSGVTHSLAAKGSFFLAYTHHRAATLHALLRTCRAPSALE